MHEGPPTAVSKSPSMNITSAVKSAVALATLSLPSLASAYPGYMADVKLALTFSFEVDGTFDRGPSGEFITVNGERVPDTYNDYTTADATHYSEEVTKVETFKYGTRELLEDMRAAGLFPEGVDSIKGWSVKEVFRNGSTAFYLYHKDTDPVRLNTNVFDLYFDEIISKRNLKEKEKRANPEGPITSTSTSGSSQAKGNVFLSFAVGLYGLDVDVRGKGTTTFKRKYPNNTSAPVALRTMKSTSLAGRCDSEDGEFYAEGSVAISPVTILENVEAIFEDFPINDG